MPEDRDQRKRHGRQKNRPTPGHMRAARQSRQRAPRQGILSCVRDRDEHAATPESAGRPTGNEGTLGNRLISARPNLRRPIPPAPANRWTCHVLLPGDRGYTNQSDATLEQAEFARRFYRQVDDPMAPRHTVIDPDDHGTVLVQERHPHHRSHGEDW